MARLGLWYTDACKWLPGVASGDPDVCSGPPVHVLSSFFLEKEGAVTASKNTVRCSCTM